jgi:predicted amidophosphoribosyltransferase
MQMVKPQTYKGNRTGRKFPAGSRPLEVKNTNYCRWCGQTREDCGPLCWDCEKELERNAKV